MAILDEISNLEILKENIQADSCIGNKAALYKKVFGECCGCPPSSSQNREE